MADLQAHVLPLKECRGDVRGIWERSRRYIVQHPDYVESVSPHASAVLISKGEEMPGALYLAPRRGRFLTCLISPPFAPFGGLLIPSDFEQRTHVQREKALRDFFSAAHQAVADRADRLEFIMPPEVTDLRGLAWSDWRVRPHYNYVTRWQEDNEWEAAMDSAARRQVKKAAKAGLSVRICKAGATEELRRLWEANAGKQQLDTQLGDSLASLGNWLAEEESGFIADVVDEDNRAHASGLFACDAHRVYYAAGASDPALHGSGAPTLLHVEVLREIERRGMPRVYDWVGANTPSVVRFKRGFGPETEVLMAAQWFSRKARILEAVR